MKAIQLLFILFMGGGAAFGQVVADFSGYPLRSCNPPYEVTFENYSQGDTAWHWEFGDGNTSFFPNPIHLYASADTYTVKLIAYGPGGTDTLIKTNFILALPPPPSPTLNKIADTINCGSGSQFIASSLHETVWFDVNNNEIARTDTFNLPFLTSPATYYVRSEDVGTPQHLGPSGHLDIGNGGFFNANRGQIFNVYSDIILKSVLVNAGTAGNRTIVLQDTFGVILQTINVFIPAGISRVQLNLELLPGNYQLMCNNANLWRNNAGFPAYPYSSTGLVEIVGSTAGPGFYYYFYDWEVSTFCRSGSQRVDVVVNGVAPPFISTDTVTVGCGAAGQLVASAPDEVNWYDASGAAIHIGDTLNVPFVGGTSTYTARNIAESAVLRLGPKDPDSVGTGGIFNSPFPAFLEFDVTTNLRLKSVMVLSGGAGLRDIDLLDGSGSLIQTISVFIPNGRSRVALNLDLAPGSYQLGGDLLNLYRNTNSAVNFPFTIPGLASITGTSNGGNLYYFFYDWEVAVVCISNPASVVLELEPPQAPILNQVVDSVSCGGGAQFIAMAPNPNHWYDLSNNKVFVGDTLDLPALTQNTSLRVRSEAESLPTKVGPANPGLLTGGGHFSFNQGETFTVYADMKLKSVLLDAGSAGNRDIVLEDGNGNFLQTVTVFAPAGRSRVQLDLELAPGSYRLMCDGGDLWRNTAGASYPYSVPGLIDITGSTATQAGYFYFFYDWEVVAICKSGFVQVDVIADELAAPVISQSTLNAPCGSPTFFDAAAPNDIYWYNSLGTEIGRGDSLHIPYALASGNYYAAQKAISATLQLGPLDPDSLGSGSFINTPAEEWLEFTAEAEIEIQSVWVRANNAGMREIEIREANGIRVTRRSVMIPAGKSRVNLNIQLPPGDYLIGGSNLNLFANDNAFNVFPYTLVGIARLTGSSGGSNTYNFFYDWELAAICSSPRDSAYLFLDHALLPAVSPRSVTLNCVDSVQFVGSGVNVMWFDQNGDFLADSDTLKINRVKNPTTYFAQNISQSPSFFGGPKDGDAIGGGGMHNAAFLSQLYFTVLADITLKSVWVNAASAGVRNIFLADGMGNPLDTLSINIPAGPGRVSLDWTLAPGDYRIGGIGMDLFRNNANVNYPYDVAGLVSITTSNVGGGFYYYFYDWELGASCESAQIPVTVNFTPVMPPAVVEDSVLIVCNGSDTLLASGLNTLIWYNVKGDEINRGDSLFAHSLKDTATYYVVNETSGKFFKGGAVDNTFGRGGYVQTPLEWMVFDVFEDVILNSVKVYARTAGNRLFQYRDAGGNILDSVTLFVPVGESRVNLKFQLQVGTNHQLAVVGNVDLFRNNANVSYPYQIGPYVTITRSNAILPFAFYHYFYDWEVGDPGCQSAAVPVFVDVAPFATPAVMQDDSICYNTTATFSTTAGAGAWYGPTGNLVGYGGSFTTNPLTAGGTYSHIGESMELRQSFGPANASAVGPGAYHNASFDAFLEFTVDAPLRLNSVWVDANVAGIRNILLQDGNGTTLQTIRRFIPAGAGRVYLGLELQPGTYAIGGKNMNLFRNDNGGSFPYAIPGLVSIHGTSTGNNFYYYFYDWEVQDIPCQSDTVSFDLTVLPQIVPFFNYTQMDSLVTFKNVSTPTAASWHWDFGDGDTSILKSPVHMYGDTGHFVVTLTVSNGGCEKQLTDSVYIAPPITDGIGELLSSSFRLFPNPGSGRFTVEAQAEGLREMEIRVYDLHGRVLYQSAPQRTAHFREEVELGEQPAGTYMVQLRADGEQIIRRYVLLK